MTASDNDITRLMEGDREKGFRLLMDKYAEPVYWHTRRLLVVHADAEDATQETFIRVFRSFGQLKNADALRSWIYSIATREALRLIEKNHRNILPASADEAEAAGVCADEYIDYSDLEAVKLQRAILSLPAKQQIAFNMRYYDDMSYDEIAAATDSTAANVKANYHFAKEKIVEFMRTND